MLNAFALTLTYFAAQPESCLIQWRVFHFVGRHKLYKLLGLVFVAALVIVTCLIIIIIFYAFFL